jgi:hypothetical protein
VSPSSEPVPCDMTTNEKVDAGVKVEFAGSIVEGPPGSASIRYEKLPGMTAEERAVVGHHEVLHLLIRRPQMTPDAFGRALESIGRMVRGA